MDRLDSVYSRRFLPLIILCYPTNCQQSCRSGFHHQFLEFVDCSCIATLFGSKDALLYAIDMLLELTPRQLVPTLTLRIRCLLDPGCLRFCHTRCTPFFSVIVPTSAYPLAFPGALASSAILPSWDIRPGRLLIVSTSDESTHEGYPVPRICFPFP